MSISHAIQAEELYFQSGDDQEKCDLSTLQKTVICIALANPYEVYERLQATKIACSNQLSKAFRRAFPKYKKISPAIIATTELIQNLLRNESDLKSHAFEDLESLSNVLDIEFKEKHDELEILKNNNHASQKEVNELQKMVDGLDFFVAILDTFKFLKSKKYRNSLSFEDTMNLFKLFHDNEPMIYKLVAPGQNLVKLVTGDDKFSQNDLLLFKTFFDKCKTAVSDCDLRFSKLNDLVIVKDDLDKRFIKRSNFNLYQLKKVATGKPMALKIIPKGEIHNQMVSNEISLRMTLKHENVLDFEDFFDDDFFFYIMTEFAPNGDLYDYTKYTKEGEAMPVLKIFTQCLKGLAALHKKSIVHRDIKPENFLFDADDNIKIEFNQNCGLATERTEYYRDIWSLGVVFYMLLCGNRKPFEGEKDSWQHENGFDNHPKEIQDIVKSMLNPDFKKIPSAEALLKTIASINNDDLIDYCC